MRVDSLEHINKIGEWVDLKEFAGRKQRLNPPHGSRTELGPAEHPVLSAERNGTNRPLKMVRIERHLWIFELAALSELYLQ